MTNLLIEVQQFIDSNNLDRAREEVAKNLSNLRTINAKVRDFAALLALGSQQALEIGLGVLGRELLKKDPELSMDAIWLFLAAVLSRQTIAINSPSRISILGLTACVVDWKLPIFTLLTPTLDSFFKLSLSQASDLIAEQTLDFIATYGESYAKAPRTNKQLQELEDCINLVLDKVDDLDLKEAWSEEIETFYQLARKSRQERYSDERIWSAGSLLLKNIYTTQALNSDTETNNNYKVKENISRFITSSLSALGTILQGDGLSVAIHISNNQAQKDWSVIANVVDKLERLFQEIADLTFNNISKLPTFTPAHAIPGSWTIIVHMNLSYNQSTSLATKLKSISLIGDSTDERRNSSLFNSWQDCIESLRRDEIIVDLAISTDAPELRILKSISTRDFPSIQAYSSPKIRIISHDVPQANDLERVIRLAELLIQYPHDPSILRQQFLETDKTADRDFLYYQAAAKILGIADERVRPTKACFVLNRLPSTEAKMRFLAYQFISSNVGAAWFGWTNANDLSEIKPESAEQFLNEVCPSLSGTTIKRRAKTLESWLNIFLEHW
ncbi:hypothetical protein [Anabaena azotica]|uniref:Uncharacterized protein n=1 Tax=Anabaena azotica FACHB-119 TaxID=947527 RepID=A0ABR8DG33_9NOST|nr:hypothetical protein [Anabaena azotica]MBD2505162.1 hypothetical protein [Anabaena azotica FACHB-119]